MNSLPEVKSVRPSRRLPMLALLIIGVGCVLFYLRSEIRLIPAERTGSPQRVLECPVDTVDFGRVFRPAKQIAYEFPIRNRSDSAVTLRISQRSCTCAAAVLAAETLGAGESTVLKVDWKVPNRVGREGFKVQIVVLGSEKDDLVCSGRVRVVDLLRAEPTEVALGTVKPGEKVRGRTLLYPSPGEALPLDLAIKPLDPPAPELTVRGIRRPNDVFEVQVTVVGQPELAGKPTEYHIPIHTGDLLQPEMILLVKVEHQDWYVPTPASVLFTQQAEGSLHRRILVDRQDGKSEPIEVDRIESDNPAVIRAEHRISDAGRLELDLQLLQPPAGYVAGKVRVYINGASHPVSIGYMVVGK